MQNVGIVGIGDMGSGLAKNLIKAGFAVYGHDLKPDRMADFVAMGGRACASAGEVGAACEAAFVMVMNGDEARDVLFGSGNNGLANTLPSGGCLLLTATIKPKEARYLATELDGMDLHIIDSPVSGGQPGAHGGTLTLMAAGTDAAMAAAQPAMDAVSGTIHHVGADFGMGQTVKACLQSLIGSIFAGAFESTALAAKAGIPGQVLYDVFSTSAAGCGITRAAIGAVIDRKFEKTGSHINTMHKDLTISMDLAMDLGVPLFTAGTAMQLFQAGRTMFPDGDNQVVARVSETIVGAGLTK